ncbi:hypothetical protein [Micromonospora luteifusca]|uniref:hypothetical protein n=1 Tax=Micromonospora luteifusca TaxID=709860 RepID=UPI001EF75598|nr:hypothetical protein [Micromonospora luteifusca]
MDGKTNEITRFAPLLDQISDLRDHVVPVEGRAGGGSEDEAVSRRLALAFVVDGERGEVPGTPQRSAICSRIMPRSDSSDTKLCRDSRRDGDWSST